MTNKSSYHTGILMFLYVLPQRARLLLLWILIRVSSVFHPWLKDLLLRYFLSGTSIRSVAKAQARASVPHFPAKPKVRPLP